MDIITFAKDVGKLKILKRTGWIRHKIPSPESVAEHSYRVAVLAMALAPHMKVDELKVIKMALIHDLGEAEIGDIVTIRGGKRLSNHKAKVEKERKGLEKILTSLDNKEEYLKLFDEYEENKTPEAQFVKQLDRLEMAIQAQEYETSHNFILEEFFQTTDAEIVDENLREIMLGLRKLRYK